MAIEPIKGFYVHDEVTDTDGVAKYDASALANLDDTVNLQGYAPDAKAVGDRLSAIEETANHADELATTLNEGGLELKDSVIEGQVDTWLDDHPEATTTVQDGAVTKAKINAAFLPEIENAYVTPEQFGAVGNGTTDDTAAIQAAFDSGEYVLFKQRTYKTTQPIIIENWLNRGFNASAAQILYTGTDYAFKFTNIVNADFYFGKVRADNGGCIGFYANDVNTWSQYVNIHFLEFSCLTNCIYAEVGHGSQWINEIRLYHGRFVRGEYAARLHEGTTEGEGHMSSWRFEKVGFEGVTNGLYSDATKDSGGHSFIDCRYSESFNILIKSTNLLRNILWVGNQAMESKYLDLAAGSRGIVISTLASDSAQYLSGYYAAIVDGKLVKTESTDYLLVPGSYTDADYDLTQRNSLMAPKRLIINAQSVTNLIIPSYYGDKNGFNEFYLSFAHPATSESPFTITKNGSVIKTFTSGGSTVIHAVYFDSTGWYFHKLTSI